MPDTLPLGRWGQSAAQLQGWHRAKKTKPHLLQNLLLSCSFMLVIRLLVSTFSYILWTCRLLEWSSPSLPLFIDPSWVRCTWLQRTLSQQHGNVDTGVPLYWCACWTSEGEELVHVPQHRMAEADFSLGGNPTQILRPPPHLLFSLSPQHPSPLFPIIFLL